MPTREDVMRKIAAALALAVDQEGTPEGTHAKAMAERLMTKHGITEVEREQDDMTHEVARTGKSNWRRRIFMAACDISGVCCVVSKAQMLLFGRPERIELCRYLYRALCNQLEAALRADLKLVYEGTRGDKAAFRSGFAYRVRERAADFASKAESTGTALRPLTEQESAEAFMSTQIKTKPFAVGRPRVSQKGLDAGDKARFSTAIRGGSSPKNPKLLKS